MEEYDQFARELRAARERIAELSATRRALETERERYRELFESAPVAYLVTDPTARIGEANRSAAALLGVEQRFLAGRPLAAFVASEDRWAFRSAVNRVGRRGDRVADRTVRLRRRSGQVVPVLVTIDPVPDADGGVRSLRWLLRTAEPAAAPRAGIAADQAAAQDEARRDHLEALADLDPATDLDGTVQVLLDAGVRLLGVDGVGLMLADGKGRPCAAGGSDESTQAFLRAQEYLMKGPGVHALLLERVVQSGDLAADARWPQLAEAAAVNAVGAVLAAPIGLYGGPIGVCLVVSAEARAWSDGDLAATEAYTSAVAALLELAAEAQRSTGLTRRLRENLQHQVVVEQAKGALMVRRGLDEAAASAELRDLARRSGRPLAEVAAGLLRRLGPPPPA